MMTPVLDRSHPTAEFRPKDDLKRSEVIFSTIAFIAPSSFFCNKSFTVAILSGDSLLITIMAKISLADREEILFSESAPTMVKTLVDPASIAVINFSLGMLVNKFYDI